MSGGGSRNPTRAGGGSTGGPAILYVGAFELPDRNAAAHRVLSNAKMLQELGYRVLLASTRSPDHHEGAIPADGSVEGVQYTIAGTGQKFANVYEARPLLQRAASLENLVGIVAYNLPVVPTLRLRAYARRRGVKMIGDIADWYTPEGGIIRRAVKWVDTFVRMQIVNRQLNGLIVISQYLAEFYGTGKPLVVIPPLVDTTDLKWHPPSNVEQKPLRLVYAGSPSRDKERLDVAIRAAAEANTVTPVHLDVVGITKQEFQLMYPDARALSSADVVAFHGRVSHQDALGYVKNAHATLLIRDDSRLTRAGFPTKFVESVACGVPVIATNSSDLGNYLAELRNGTLADPDELSAAIVQFANRDHSIVEGVSSNMFDFRAWTKKARTFLDEVGI